MCEGSSILLHVRCGGCAKMYQRDVRLPVGRVPPSDGDELMEHPEVRDMVFRCPRCEAPFAEVVAFKLLSQERAA